CPEDAKAGGNACRGGSGTAGSAQRLASAPMERQRMTASDALSPALKPPPPPFEAALEAVELELALGKRDTKQDLCEQIIRETVESVGGILLFQIRIGEGRDQRWVGAVAFA